MANRVVGIVKQWSAINSNGFIKHPNGIDIFVHASALKNGLRNLITGQSVEFSIELGNKGFQAVDVASMDEITSNRESSTLISQSSHSLSIFLCHSSADKSLVRKLHEQLKSDNFDPWLDEEKILAGQDWRREIAKAVRKADIVIVCLSRNSISKAGFVQKEINDALDIADEQPEDKIFLIPLKLEECKVPDRLSRWQWVNYFDGNGYKKLLTALNARAATI